MLSETLLLCLFLMVVQPAVQLRAFSTVQPSFLQRSSRIGSYCRRSIIGMAKPKQQGDDNDADDGSERHCRRDGILMILSPAKTLDLTSDLPFDGEDDLPLTRPECSLEQTTQVATAMKSLSAAALTKKLKVSAKLGQTAFEHWQNFAVTDNHAETEEAGVAIPVLFERPCVYTYSGAAYQGLNVRDCSREAVLYLQHNLRILSAVYGLLRPLDQIQPYRLEMGTTNVLLPNNSNSSSSPKLAQFWSEAVTASLSNDLLLTNCKNDDNDDDCTTDGPILLNLASDEYAAAVDPQALLPPHSRYIKAVFQDDGRVVAVHAKRARGLMVRYLAEHRVRDLNGIRSFDSEGYRLVDAQSDDTTLVFHRAKQQQPVAAKNKRAASKPTATARKGKKTKAV